MKLLKKRTFACMFLCGALILLGSCNKQDAWLDAKRLSVEVTPTSLADYQLILNNDNAMNNLYTTYGLTGADNIYVSDTNYPSVVNYEQDGYLWKRSMWDDVGGFSQQWNNFYTVIEYANIVLDGLKKIDPNTAGYNDVEGQALFYRAISLYTLAQIFCKPYNTGTVATDLGLPLRMSSDVNIIYQRSNLQATYTQILNDANNAANMLVSQSVLYGRRPNQNAAWALLAKIYLVMGDYTNAGLYANKVLNNVSSLLDFNSSLVSLSTTYRFPVNGINNPEILFYAQAIDVNLTRPYSITKSYVDPTLYSSYSNNDLRKTYFYAANGTNQQFRGPYTGGSSNFCGIGTNEIYLIRAECFARSGNTTAALADLNALLVKRYVTGTFTPITASSANAALVLVLQERRKELPFTADIRWEDLRRLNSDPNFQITITRVISGTSYSLPPNDPRYVLPIPTNEVQLDGLQQNP